ncbi:MAG: ABC transporter ATP-binding protein, partial [Microbacterium sp.]|nr:ABC transporter ATP-binding protein [Microbacterium sp.]
MTTLTITSLTKDFKGTKVLKGIDLSMRSGEFVSLLGPSGCGKTTLLRCIAGLESPSSGTIEIAGQDVTKLPPEKRHLGMMFQSYALFPHMSVVENVRFGLRMAGDKPK